MQLNIHINQFKVFLSHYLIITAAFISLLRLCRKLRVSYMNHILLYLLDWDLDWCLEILKVVLIVMCKFNTVNEVHQNHEATQKVWVESKEKQTEESEEFQVFVLLI